MSVVGFEVGKYLKASIARILVDVNIGTTGKWLVELKKAIANA
ncbi:MAG: hypothetical protein R3A80_02600 [Bdellovibrionota bacterium]